MPRTAIDRWIEDNLTTDDILKIPGVLELVQAKVMADINKQLISGTYNDDNGLSVSLRQFNSDCGHGV